MRTLRALVMGPTGAAGSEIVRQCLRDARIESVLAVSRRRLDVTHAKLRVTLIDDFLDFSPLAAELAQIDACFCALGTSQVSVPDPVKYREITHDYVLAVARLLREQNANARFYFISGREIDADSKRLYVRVKAETEQDLRTLFGDRVTMFRPGYIHPIEPRKQRVWQDRVLAPFVFLRPLLPDHVTDTSTLAKAMLYAALESSATVLDNRALEAAAAAYDTQFPALPPRDGC